MSVTILGPMQTSVRRNQFILTVEYEHGDADLSDSESFVFFRKNEHELEMAVKFLRACKNEFVRTRDGSPSGFDMKLFDNFMRPDQIFNGGGAYAEVTYIDVTWYDENGVAYNVEVN